MRRLRAADAEGGWDEIRSDPMVRFSDDCRDFQRNLRLSSIARERSALSKTSSRVRQSRLEGVLPSDSKAVKAGRDPLIATPQEHAGLGRHQPGQRALHSACGIVVVLARGVG
jgi:hypothetical protein